MIVIEFVGAHKGTGFKSLHWTVPATQTRYELCMCKHTQSPPYCDGTHTNLPSVVLERQKNCSSSATTHVPDCKLCTGCGWAPDFWYSQNANRMKWNLSLINFIITSQFTFSLLQSFIKWCTDCTVHDLLFLYNSLFYSKLKPSIFRNLSRK